MLLYSDLYYIAIILIALGFAYLLGIFTGAHYVPTSDATTERMLDLTNAQKGEMLVDLGSGDGKILIAAAGRGLKAHGYEINPLLVWWSRRKIREAGCAGLASVSQKNFWHQDFSQYDIVTVYGITHIMPALEKKFERELKPSARVVCNTFPLPNWKGEQHENIYLYVKKYQNMKA